VASSVGPAEAKQIHCYLPLFHDKTKLIAFLQSFPIKNSLNKLSSGIHQTLEGCGFLSYNKGDEKQTRHTPIWSILLMRSNNTSLVLNLIY
jgi:hypothetical protein